MSQVGKPKAGICKHNFTYQKLPKLTICLVDKEAIAIADVTENSKEKFVYK